MPFLVVGGTTVSVQAPGGLRHEVEEFGERVRAFDGTMRTAVRARKSRWSVTTTPMLRAAADTFVGILNGSPPVACSGDVLGGSVNCHPEYQAMAPVPTSGGVTRFAVLFVLHEA